MNYPVVMANPDNVYCSLFTPEGKKGCSEDDLIFHTAT